VFDLLIVIHLNFQEEYLMYQLYIILFSLVLVLAPDLGSHKKVNDLDVCTLPYSYLYHSFGDHSKGSLFLLDVD